tara:strand:- start:4170 stop:4406 length:237 start_codon:yes stop_codon:yes gene_type:complete
MPDYVPIGQKFPLGSRVNKKRNVGMSIKRSSINGEVISVEEKLNTRGRTCYYYTIRWVDQRVSKHAQHILVASNDKTG